MTTNNTPLILGFGHKARQGKDEAAKTIIRERGGELKIVTIAFADALRQEVNDAVEEMVSTGKAKAGWRFVKWRFRKLTAHQNALKRLCKIWGATFDPFAVADDVYKHGKQRDLLQTIGQGRRDLEPDYWLAAWEQAVNASDADVIIVPDMRYPNEMLRIVERGGVTVKFTRVGYIPDPIAAQHVSENALNDATFDRRIVVNDGDIDMLRMKALHVFDFIMRQRNGW